LQDSVAEDAVEVDPALLHASYRFNQFIHLQQALPQRLRLFPLSFHISIIQDRANLHEHLVYFGAQLRKVANYEDLLSLLQHLLVLDECELQVQARGLDLLEIALNLGFVAGLHRNDPDFLEKSQGFKPHQFPKSDVRKLACAQSHDLLNFS